MPKNNSTTERSLTSTQVSGAILAPVVVQEDPQAKPLRNQIQTPVALKTFTVIINGKEYTFFGDEAKLSAFKQSLTRDFGMTLVEGSLENSDKFEIKPKEGKAETDMNLIKELSKNEEISHFSQNENGDITFENNTKPQKPILLVCMDQDGNVVGELNPKTGEFKYQKGKEKEAETFCKLSGINSINGKILTNNGTEEELSVKYEVVSAETKLKILAQKKALEEIHHNAQSPSQTTEKVEQSVKKNPIDSQLEVKRESEPVANKQLNPLNALQSTSDTSQQSFINKQQTNTVKGNGIAGI